MTDPKTLTDELLAAAAEVVSCWRDTPFKVGGPISRLAFAALATREQRGERNQCDGCVRGLPKSARGVHYNPDGSYDLIGCTADLYAAPVEQAGSTPDETLREHTASVGYADGFRAGEHAQLLREAHCRRAEMQPGAPGFDGADAWNAVADETLREALAERLRKMRGDYLGDGVNPGVRVSELLRALATPTKPEMQPEALVSSCQALSETVGDAAQKSDAERYRWLRDNGHAADWTHLRDDAESADQTDAYIDKKIAETK